MIVFVKKYPLSTLLGLTALAVITELIWHVSYGYYPSGNILFIFSMGLLAVFRYILILICLAVTITSIVKRQHEIFFILLWIVLAVLGQIPKGHFETLGALLSLYNENPNQVLDDSRMLMDEYLPMTCIGYQPERHPCDNPLTRDRLPNSIQRIHAGRVLILEDYVLIEKFGLQGVFRGFVVFQKGSDLWTNEKSVILEDWCNTCWKIRIIDGLYWYHANPADPPIFTLPLK